MLANAALISGLSSRFRVIILRRPPRQLSKVHRGSVGGDIRILSRGVFSRNLKTVDVELSPDQQAFARRAIESGRFQSEAEAVKEALALWEERERQRAEFLMTLEDARASLGRGEGRVITQESMQELAKEVKERGLARLLAELTASR